MKQIFVGVLLFIGVMALESSLWAAPGYTTYQAKIVKPNGNPLTASSVNFKFTIMDPTGTCILYSETFGGVNMSNSAGLAAFSLGTGIKSYPTSATTFEKVFSNTTPFLSCEGGTPPSYAPAATDIRKLVMQFHDGSGWQTLPAMNINAVPYAMYANNSSALNGFTSNDFVRVSQIPSCLASEALQYTGLAFVCVPASGGGAVTSGSIIAALGYTPAVSASVNTLSASVTAVVSSIADLSASMATFVSSPWVTSSSALSYSGAIGVNTTSPKGVLDINGTILATGTIAGTSTTITGSGTLFTTEISPGDNIRVGSSDPFGEERTVMTITDDTTMTLNKPFAADPAGSIFYLRRKVNLGEGNVSIGRARAYKIHSSAALFADAVPKLEVQTGAHMLNGYSEVMTLRHNSTFNTAYGRQLGLLMKLSTEDNLGESNKMGGIMVESNDIFANNAYMSFLTNNRRRMTILSSGQVGVGTSAPTTTFEVSGSVKFAGSTTPISGAVLTSDTNGVATWRMPAAASVTSASVISAFGYTPANSSTVNTLTTNINSVSSTVLLLNAASGSYVRKTGDTMTGSLAVSANLDVSGTFRFNGGSPGVGKVLTSDINGFATWQNPSAALPGVTSAAISSTLNLTSSSTQYQLLTPTGGSLFVNLPTTGVSTGQRFFIRNNTVASSSDYLSIYDNGQLLDTVYPGKTTEWIYENLGWRSVNSNSNTNIPIGRNAVAVDSVAIGNNSSAYFQGVAVGTNATTGAGAAFGNFATANNYGVAVGPSAGGSDHGVAIGFVANGSTQGVAVGRSSQAGVYGVALGSAAQGTNYSVALGYQAGSGSNLSSVSGTGNVYIGSYAGNNASTTIMSLFTGKLIVANNTLENYGSLIFGDFLKRRLSFGLNTEASMQSTVSSTLNIVKNGTDDLFSASNLEAGDIFVVKNNGNVGVGTENPGQKLTVSGTVESTYGGFRFPDGTLQTTAGNAGTSVSITAPVTFVNNTWTTISWNTEEFDDLSWHDNAIDPSRITVTATGRYRVTTSVCFNHTNNGGVGIDVFKNGSSLNKQQSVILSGGGTYGVTSQCGNQQFSVQLNSGDYLELRALSGTGSNQDLQTNGTYFQVERIR